jgi:thioredoxin-related protein
MIAQMGARLQAQTIYTFEEAKAIASSEHKNILLNFSGSDWCAQCILMKKNIFDDKIFNDYAQEHLIVFHADFPRQKKNQLLPEQQKINSALADKYNNKGIFPFTILLSPEGKVLKTWEGNPKGTAEDFVSAINLVTFK